MKFLKEEMFAINCVMIKWLGKSKYNVATEHYGYPKHVSSSYVLHMCHLFTGHTVLLNLVRSSSCGYIP